MSVCSNINAGASMLFYYNIPLHVGRKGEIREEELSKDGDERKVLFIVILPFIFFVCCTNQRLLCFKFDHYELL